MFGGHDTLAPRTQRFSSPVTPLGTLGSTFSVAAHLLSWPSHGLEFGQRMKDPVYHQSAFRTTRGHGHLLAELIANFLTLQQQRAIVPSNNLTSSPQTPIEHHGHNPPILGVRCIRQYDVIVAIDIDIRYHNQPHALKDEVLLIFKHDLQFSETSPARGHFDAFSDSVVVKVNPIMIDISQLRRLDHDLWNRRYRRHDVVSTGAGQDGKEEERSTHRKSHKNTSKKSCCRRNCTVARADRIILTIDSGLRLKSNTKITC